MEWLQTCLALALGVLAPVLVGLLVVLLVGAPIYLCMKLWELAACFLLNPVVHKLHEIPFIGRFLSITFSLIIAVPLMAFVFFMVIFPSHFLILSWCGAEFGNPHTGLWYYDFYHENFEWLGRWISPLGNPDGPVAKNPYLALIWTLLEAPFLSFTCFIPWLFEIRIFLWMVAEGFIG